MSSQDTPGYVAHTISLVLLNKGFFRSVHAPLTICQFTSMLALTVNECVRDVWLNAAHGVVVVRLFVV